MATEKTKVVALEAKAKGAQAQTIRALVPIAKEINVRLDKASKLQGDADDYRLGAALFLVKARDACDKVKINFKKWAEANISLSYESARKLVAVGAAKDPKAALADWRERNRRNMQVSRDKRKAISAPSRGSQGRAGEGRAVTYEDAVTVLKGGATAGRKSAAESIAATFGAAVVTKEDAARVHAIAFDSANALFEEFQRLGGETERKRFAGRCVASLGGTVDWPADKPAKKPKSEAEALKALTDIPPELRRNVAPPVSRAEGRRRVHQAAEKKARANVSA